MKEERGKWDKQTEEITSEHWRGKAVGGIRGGEGRIARDDGVSTAARRATITRGALGMTMKAGET